MTKPKNTTKIIIALVGIIIFATMLGAFTLTVFAAEDLTVTIDTGESVTLKDTDSDGYYEIGTADELYAFAAAVADNKNSIDVKLTANITINEGVMTAESTGVRIWTPITNSYYGTFDGDGHTVSGLYFNDTSAEDVGLFGEIGFGSKVLNVGVINSYFSGNYYVGGIVGRSFGIIENCYNASAIHGVSAYIGGVVGYQNGKIIKNCYNTGTITNVDGQAGGVAGMILDGATIENCYNTGDVIGSTSALDDPDDLGGVVGVTNNGSMLNCYNTGNVSGKNNVGGLVGSGGASVKNCYNTGDVSGEENVGGVVGYDINSIGEGGTTTNCYNTGNVKGYRYVGGIMGKEITNSSIVDNCYYLSGCAKDGSSTVQNGIGAATNGSTTADVSGESASVTSEQLQSGEIAYRLGTAFGQRIDNGVVDALPVFAAEDGSNKVYYGYEDCGDDTPEYTNSADPVLYAEKPDHTYTNGICSECNDYSEPTVEASGDFAGYYKIENAGQLYWFAQYVNAGNANAKAYLANNIEVNPGLSAISNDHKYIINLDNSPSSYYALGTGIGGTTAGAFYAKQPDGTYVIVEDTDAYNIERIRELSATYLRPWTPIGNYPNEYAGTFNGNGYTVSGLYFNDTSVNYVGLFGYVRSDGKVDKVEVINSFFSGKNYVGGVAGFNFGSVENSYSTGVVSGADFIGGVVGDNYGSVEKSYNTGIVSGTKSVGGMVGYSTGDVTNCTNYGIVSGTENVGGVVGETYDCSVLNCSNTGDVSGTNYIGGVVGYDRGYVQDCNNTGDVSATKSVGGVAGYTSGTVTKCYNTGTVSGRECVGGVAGYNTNSVSNCYNTGSVSVHDESSDSGTHGGVVGYNDGGTVINSYNTGAVNGGTWCGGGVVGFFYQGAVSNCYNVGEVSGSANYTGGVIGYALSGTVNNCYFYKADSASYNGIGDATSTTISAVESKNADQFARGEVAYLLNGGKTDGTQAFYQTVGEADITFDSAKGTVYQTTVCPVYYSNTENTEKAHIFTANGFCIACGGNEQPTLNADGYYEIDNAGKLYWFAQRVNDGATEINGILTANITVNEGTMTAESTDARKWTPIGDNRFNYAGTFNGNGYTVSGLYFNDTSVNYVGLFGYVRSSGTVQNVGVINSYFNGKQYVGGVAGHNSGAVTNCYNTGSVSGDEPVGGVVGINSNDGTVKNCYNTGAVNGTSNYVGGVVGYNYGAVTNCYNTGSVKGDGYHVGGVVGQSWDGTVTNSYNTGSVSGYSNAGGVLGSNSGTGTVKNCYYDSTFYTGNAIGKNNNTAEGAVENTEAKSTAQFKSGEVAYLLNGDQTTIVFKQTLGENGDAYPSFTGETVYKATLGCTGGYVNDTATVAPHVYAADGFCAKCDAYEPATLNADGVYEIDNAGKLYWFAALVGGTLTDGTAQNTSANAILNKDIVINEGVLAEMAKNTPDTSGFRAWTPIGRSSNKYNGVFNGDGHTVSGLYFNGTSMNYIGLFGYLETNGKVMNVGVIDSYFYGKGYVGGLVGRNYGTVENCYNTGTVKGEYDVGGVVGYNNGTVENCYNTGTVKGEYNVGGIVGYNVAIVKNCYNTGNVSGTATYVGGVDGFNDGRVKNCFYLIGCAKDGSNVVQNGIGNETRGSTTEDTENSTTAKTAEQFESGEVAYLLGEAFGQDVTTGENDTTVDALPVFAAADGSNKLYRYGTGECTSIEYKYANVETAHQVVHNPYACAYEEFIQGNDGAFYCKVEECGAKAIASVTRNGLTVSEYFTTLADAVNYAKNEIDSTITLLESIELSDALTIMEGKFTIDLNGNTLSNSNGDVIRIYNVANITVTSGVVGGKIEAKNACVFVSKGIAKVTGVTLNGTGAFGSGAAANGAEAVLTLENVNVTSAYGGVTVADGGRVEILGNSSISGDIHDISCMKNSTLTLGTGVTFPGGLTAFKANNYKELKLLCADGMAYWTGENQMALLGPDTYEIAGDVTVREACFHSDTAKYAYAAEGATITATCTNCSCTAGTSTLRLVSGNLTYDGVKKELSVRHDIGNGIAIPEIVCATDLTSAGAHTASITLGGATATLTIEIEKATLSLSDFVITNTSLEYALNTEQGVDVELPDGLDAQYVTVVYTQSGSPATPKDAGIYSVYIKVQGSPNHNDTAIDAGRLTITPRSVVNIYVGKVNEEFFYNGSEIEPTVTVDLGSLPFDPKGYGGTVSYSNNIDAGEATVTLGGNFTGSATFDIKKATPTITVSAPLDKVMPGYVMDITAVTGAVDNFIKPTTFTVVDGEGYSVSGKTITIDEGVKIGSTVTVKVTSTATDNYTAGEGTLTLTVGIPTVDTAELETALEALKNRVTELENKHGENGEIAAIKDDIEAIEFALSGYATDAELADAVNRIASLETKTTEIETTYAKKADLDAAISRLDALLKDENGVESGRIPEIEAEIDAITALIGQIGDGNTVKSEIDRLGRLIEALTARVSANETAIGANTQSIAALQNALSGLDTALTAIGSDSLADALTDLDSALDALTARVTANEEAITALQGEITRLEGLIAEKADADEIAAQINTINAKLGELTTEDTALDGRLDKIETALGTLIDESLPTLIDSIENDVDKNASDITAINTALGDLAELVGANNADLGARLAAMQTEINGILDRVTKAEADIAKIKEDLAKAVADLNAADVTNADAIAAAVKRIDALEEAAKALGEKDAALEKALEDAKTALEAKIKEVSDKLAEEVGKLEAADVANANKLTSEIARVEGLIEAAKAAATAADGALKTELEKAIKEADDAIKQLIKDLDGRVTEAEKAIVDLNSAVVSLRKADETNANALSTEIARVEGLIKTAEEAAKTADGELKKELENAILSAKAELDKKITEVQTNLEEAVKTLNETIAKGDKANSTELSNAITKLNEAIEAANAAAVSGDNDLKNKLSEAQSALQAAIKAVQDKLDEAVGSLNDKDTKLNERIDALASALDAAEAAYRSADAALKSELTSSISRARNQLQFAIDEVASDLESAKAELSGAIENGDKALDDKIAALNEALDAAKAALEAADETNKAELISKIETADAALDEAVKAVQKNLDDAKAELDKTVADLDAAVKAGDKALDDKIVALNTALDTAKAALEKADADNKAALTAKIEAADKTLDAAVKAVQKNLDDAKAALNKAMADGDKALDDKIADLNASLDAAKAALEAADADNRAELVSKIEAADADLDAAVKQLASDLADAKAALEAKDAEIEEKLDAAIIAISSAAGVGISGNVALLVWIILLKRKRSLL